MGLSDMVKELPEKCKELWAKLTKGAGSAADKTKVVAGDAVEKTKVVAGAAVDKTKEVAATVVDKTKEVTGKAGEKIEEADEVTPPTDGVAGSQ
jgi:dsDNA-specific endonuclease/ATPase MutS2